MAVLYSAIPSPEEVIAEQQKEEIKEEEKYVPELEVLFSHDFKTYWKETFRIDIQSFDGKINSDPKSSSDFSGRLDGVDVTVWLRYDTITSTAYSPGTITITEEPPP